MGTSNLDEGTFLDVFAEYFDLGRDEIAIGASLVGDLGFDSIQMVEVMLLLEELSMSDVPEGILGEHTTLLDVFELVKSYSHMTT